MFDPNAQVEVQPLSTRAEALDFLIEWMQSHGYTEEVRIFLTEEPHSRGNLSDCYIFFVLQPEGTFVVSPDRFVDDNYGVLRKTGSIEDQRETMSRKSVR